MPYKIFVVEDHPIMRQAYADVLEREDELELCGTAETAEKALDMLETTDCDLIVVDISLPGMDGLELAELLLVRKPDLPVVIISAHEEAILGNRVRRTGARAFLSKKNLATTLTDTLWQVLLSGPMPGEQSPTLSPS